MNIETVVSLIASTWHIPPVRWAVYATIALYVLYVYVMRLRRIRDGKGLSLAQKVIGYPVSVVAVALDWAYNWTIASALYREFPHTRSELVTQRLQRALDHPDEYAGYRLWIARRLRPLLNEHDRGHLE